MISNKERKSICFICSSGGHLNQSLKIIEGLSSNEFNITLVTYENEFTQKLENSVEFKVILFPQKTSELAGNTSELIKHMLKMTIETVKLLYRNDFDVIVSTGAEIAIPVMVISQATHCKFIYIESLSRINELSKTGQLSIYFADQTLAQWEELAEQHESVEFRGRII